MKSEGARFYLSKEFEFKRGMQYVLKLKTTKAVGNIGNILAILKPELFVGNVELLATKALKEGGVFIKFVVKESCVTSLRLGIGTSTQVQGLAEVEIESLNIVEQLLPSREISNFAKEYIDPEFELPQQVGLGNDYTFIEDQANQLLNGSIEWEAKRLSIVIPSYERIDLLRKTLATIVRQTYPQKLIDVTVVDDGSIENNYEDVFNEFSSKLTLYLARQKHRGYGLCRARNLGARSAPGEVLLFLDSDILLPANFIRNLMAYHHVSDDCSVLGVRKFVDSEKATVDDLLTGKYLLKTCRNVIQQTHI